MKDQKLSDFSFKSTNQVITIGTKDSVSVNGEELNVDPQLLFQRLITEADSSQDDVEGMFKYELSGNPSSLFEPSGILREAEKPLLANYITKGYVV
ncbi:hypothetical protein DPMN_146361 [Dreissena polymorpha]|uniref:Uncharacterized protein n=1 Tax=Dreissena polymorpha TaxID=45954 RepID=A0A9D4J296_DREPO|nr:hypothetical protein DPMN_146361 [Dreissena polymorpha]